MTLCSIPAWWPMYNTGILLVQRPMLIGTRERHINIHAHPRLLFDCHAPREVGPPVPAFSSFGRAPASLAGQTGETLSAPGPPLPSGFVSVSAADRVVSARRAEEVSRPFGCVSHSAGHGAVALVVALGRHWSPDGAPAVSREETRV